MTEPFEKTVQVANGVLGLTPMPIVDASNAEWARMMQSAASHHILPVVMKAYAMSGMKPDISILPWIGQMEIQRRQLAQVEQSTWKLADIMRNAGLDVMFFKGLTLNKYYPDGVMRVPNDIDYYLYGENEKGVTALSREGFLSQREYYRHTKASIEGVTTEGHYNFLDTVNFPSTTAIDDTLKRLADIEGRSVAFGNTPGVYAMTPTMNAIFLTAHLAKHFAHERVPARMFYDWVLVLEKEKGNVDWDLVAHTLSDGGMLYFAGIIKDLVKMKMGIPSDVRINGARKKDVERVWGSMHKSVLSKETHTGMVAKATDIIANRWKFRVVYKKEHYARALYRLAKSSRKKRDFF